MAAMRKTRQQVGVGKAIDQVDRNIDKVELWAAALGASTVDVPGYDFRRMAAATWRPVQVQAGVQTRIGIKT